LVQGGSYANADNQLGGGRRWRLEHHRGLESGTLSELHRQCPIDTTDLHTVTHNVGTDSIHTLAVGNDDFVMSGGQLTIKSTASFANLVTVSGGTLIFEGQTTPTVTIANFAQSGGVVTSESSIIVTGAASFTSTSTETGDGGIDVAGSASVASGAVVNVGPTFGLVIAGNGSTIAGLVTGNGDLTFGEGTVTLNSGAGISVLRWDIYNHAVATLGEDLTYANYFGLDDATIDLGGHTLNLTGNPGFGGGGAAARMTGAGALNTYGVTQMFGDLILGGGVTWTNSGTVYQSGRGLSADLRGAANVINTSSAIFDTLGPTSITAQSFVNHGVLEKTGGRRISFIKAPVDNTGTISVSSGTLEFDKITGAGIATISGGTLKVKGANFAENVSFLGASGALTLGHSETYTGNVTGFSSTGGTSFDLRDIGFVSAGEATFSGTTTSGVLTVTDGTHTAHITLIGDYTGSPFVASDDGNGGVNIVDPATSETVVASSHRFIAAMASLGARAGAAHATSGAHPDAWRPVLSTPRMQIA
jgi:hypothetical protein